MAGYHFWGVQKSAKCNRTQIEKAKLSRRFEGSNSQRNIFNSHENYYRQVYCKVYDQCVCKMTNFFS